MKIETQAGNGLVNIARRSFLRYVGAGIASAGLLAATACHKDHKVIVASGIDIGLGDIGILNYAYVFEQLEAAFYTQVIASPYSGMNSTELSYITSIRDHEICHRELLKKLLTGNAIVGLAFNFSTIDFNSRASVLANARLFEDMGVAAYDGVAYIIKNPTYLTILGKIVSVEARHAALIRDLISGGSFTGSDVAASNGLNNTINLAQGLTNANAFLESKVSASSFEYLA